MNRLFTIENCDRELEKLRDELEILEFTDRVDLQDMGWYVLDSDELSDLYGKIDDVLHQKKMLTAYAPQQN